MNMLFWSKIFFLSSKFRYWRALDGPRVRSIQPNNTSRKNHHIGRTSRLTDRKIRYSVDIQTDKFHSCSEQAWLIQLLARKHTWRLIILSYSYNVPIYSKGEIWLISYKFHFFFINYNITEFNRMISNQNM